MLSITWKVAMFAAAGGAVCIFIIRRRIAGKICPSSEMMDGKTVIVTGANSGIGKDTALEMARRKARVILACRDVQLARDAVKWIRSRTKNGHLVVKQLDLASLTSIRKFSDDIEKTERVNILVNNAGVYQCPFEKTEDGFEMQFAVNHLGPFFLTNLLLPTLRKFAPSRIVFVSSSLYKFGTLDFDNLNGERKYCPKAGYHNSKLAGTLFARELANRLEATGVSVHCLSPGMAWTNLARHVNISPVFKLLLSPIAWLLLKTPNAASQTVVYCAVAKELDGVTGQFYKNCAEIKWASFDDETCKRLWTISENLVGLEWCKFVCYPSLQIIDLVASTNINLFCCSVLWLFENSKWRCQFHSLKWHVKKCIFLHINAGDNQNPLCWWTQNQRKAAGIYQSIYTYNNIMYQPNWLQIVSR